MINHLIRQNEMLLSIIAGVYGQSQIPMESVVPNNNRQAEELKALFEPRETAGGEL